MGADLTFGQEMLRTGVQAVGVALAGGLSILSGWLLLRRQERIKRDEELAAGMRRLRVDALVKVLEAIGRYHSEKSRRMVYQRDVGVPNDEQTKLFLGLLRHEDESLREAGNVVAATYFLLDSRLGPIVKQRFWEIGRAEVPADAEKAAIALQDDLAAWIPAQESNRRP